MLELCLGLQPFRSRLAVDHGTITRFRRGITTLGRAVSAFGLWGGLEAGSQSVQFGFTMSTLLPRIGNGESWKIAACPVASGSYLESTLRKNKGRGLARPTSPLRARPCLSLAESYSCTQNKNDSLGLITLAARDRGTSA